MKEKIRKSKQKKGRGLLLSFYEFNQEQRVPRLIRAIKMGFRVALVSDAGTPTISDPGYKFINQAQLDGIAVEPLPGPCAVTTALSACGFPSESFQFLGYLSKTQSLREETLIVAGKSGMTTVFYESPNRILKTLATIEDVLGPKQLIFIAFELTKKFETHYRGKVSEIRQQMEEKSEGQKLKGEVTLILAPGEDEEQYMAEIAKGTGFDPKRDSKVNVNIIEIARQLNSEVDMAEAEFRELMKKLFPQIPTYHISAVVRIVKKDGKESRMERLSRLVGGVV